MSWRKKAPTQPRKSPYAREVGLKNTAINWTFLEHNNQPINIKYKINGTSSSSSSYLCLCFSSWHSNTFCIRIKSVPNDQQPLLVRWPTRPVCSDVSEMLIPIKKAQPSYFQDSFALKLLLDALELPDNAKQHVHIHQD